MREPNDQPTRQLASDDWSMIPITLQPRMIELVVLVKESTGLGASALALNELELAEMLPELLKD